MLATPVAAEDMLGALLLWCTCKVNLNKPPFNNRLVCFGFVFLQVKSF